MSDTEHYAGIDIGATNIKYGLTDSKGEVKYRNQKPTLVEKGAKPLLHLITNIAEDLLFRAAEDLFVRRQPDPLEHTRQLSQEIQDPVRLPAATRGARRPRRPVGGTALAGRAERGNQARAASPRGRDAQEDARRAWLRGSDRRILHPAAKRTRNSSLHSRITEVPYVNV